LGNQNRTDRTMAKRIKRINSDLQNTAPKTNCEKKKDKITKSVSQHDTSNIKD
jgi:hypothetical protein